VGRPDAVSRQIVPIGASALQSSKLIKNARLVVYKGAPHGMPSTLKDQINRDLYAFFRESTRA
jgi:non-heme chloroperoxidase